MHEWPDYQEEEYKTCKPGDIVTDPDGSNWIITARGKSGSISRVLIGSPAEQKLKEKND